jgi:glucuronosyltransferase
MNGAEHGVIYFSMGSMIQADTLPDDKRQAFVQAFSELPQRVLWKWEADTLPGQPKNVKTAKWLPQFDILSKNIRPMLRQVCQGSRQT